MNSALLGAERKGWDAAKAGKPEGACPYPDHRASHGIVTWSRAFQNAWRDGHRKAEKGEPRP